MLLYGTVDPKEGVAAGAEFQVSKLGQLCSVSCAFRLLLWGEG